MMYQCQLKYIVMFLFTRFINVVDNANLFYFGSIVTRSNEACLKYSILISVVKSLVKKSVSKTYFVFLEKHSFLTVN